jgi:hypothetical protein
VALENNSECLIAESGTFFVQATADAISRSKHSRFSSKKKERIMVRMLTAAVALAFTLTLVQPAFAAKKPKVAAIPTGYSKVESVDADKMTLTLAGDSATYKFTKDTSNADKISVGAIVKLALKDNTKDVTGVEVAPATPAKKKKNQ